MLLSVLRRLRFPYRQDHVFAVIFFMVVFVPLIFTNHLNDNIETPKIALWIICLGVLALFYSRQRTTFRVNWLLALLLIAFVGWSALSAMWSLDVVNSLVGLYGRFTSSVLFYVVWALTVLIFSSYLNRDKWLFLVKTLVLSGAVVAVFGLVQSTGVAFYAGLEEPVRPLVPSFLGNPNFSSMFLASILPFGLLFALQSQSLTSRIYYASTTILMMVGLALFGSRGSLIAAFCALVIMVILMLYWRLGKKLVLGTAVGLLLTVGIAISFLSATRPSVVGQTLEFSETTVETRFVVWNDSLQIIERYPWLGTGPGNFFIAFNQIANPLFANSEQFDDAHNLVLHLAVNGGIIFALLFLIIVGWSLGQGWLTARATRDPLFIVLLAATLAWLISASFNPVVSGCWLLLAVLLSGLLLSGQRNSVFPVGKYKAVLLFGLGIVAIVAPLAFVASDALANQMTAAYNQRNWEKVIALGQWSRRLNPLNPTVSAYWASARIKLTQPPEETEDLITYLLSLHPRSPRVQHMAATLYYLLYRQTNNDYYMSQVEPALQQTVALQPHQSLINSHVAYIYYKLEKRDQALHYTYAALVKDNKQFSSWVLLAKLAHERGDQQAFNEALQKIYSLRPSPLLKKTLEQAEGDDLTKTTFPVIFPEPDI